MDALRERVERLQPGPMVVDFAIVWMSFDPDDDDEAADSGWYVTATAPDGKEWDIGPDAAEESGYSTLDEALVAIHRWSTQRAVQVTVDLDYGLFFARLSGEQDGREDGT